MRTLAFILTAVLLFSTKLIFAQEIELINSGELLDQGIKLYDDGKYKEAIAVYEKIDRNDTNYFIALYETGLTYGALEEWNKVVTVSKEGLKIKNENRSQFFLLLGSAYTELKKYDEAVLVWEQSLKEFPFDFLLWYNKGYTYRQAGKYDDAIKCYQKAIDLNIFHAASHYELGTLCANNDKYIPAMLSLTMAVMLEPASSRGRNILIMLESMSNMSFEKEKEEPATVDFEDEQFADLDMIVKSKVALSKKYKSKVKASSPIFKQLQVICEKLQVSPENKGFWSKTYVKFYKDLMDEGYFEPLCYHIFSNINDDEIQSWLKRNKGKWENFTSWAGSELFKQANDKTIIEDGKEIPMKHWYYKSHHLKSTGNIKDLSKKESISIGKWTYYYESGAFKGVSMYDDKGKQTGEGTIYYESGPLKEISDYENDQIKSYSNEYYENGKLMFDLKYKDNKLDGVCTGYQATGLPKLEITFKGGKKNGLATVYHKNGDKQKETWYKDDEIDSVEIEYYTKNRINSITHYIKGKRDGEYIEYANNGTVVVKGNFKDDKYNGEWKYWHENGQPKMTYKFNSNGDLECDVKEYNKYGILYIECSYKNGKKDGLYKEYDDDGVLYYTYEYNKGKLNKYTFYDKNGKVISEDTRKRDKIQFKFLYPNGNVRAEGTYDIDDAKIGEWRYYYPNSQLKSIEQYKNGELEGKLVTYYLSGQVRLEENYSGGNEDGYSTSYYGNGTKSGEGWYRKGDKVGDWYYYNVNGELSSTEYYLDGVQQGYQTDYHVDGKANYDYYRKDDYIHFYVFFDTLGNVLDTIDVPCGTGHVKTLHCDGKTEGEGEYKNGSLDGNFKFFYPSGKLEISVNYYKGDKDGKYESFYENGKKKAEGQYTEGEISGNWIWYWPNGNLAKKGSYDEEGNEQGEWTWFYENGKKEVVKNFKDGMAHGDAFYYDEDGNLRLKKLYNYDYWISYTYLGKDGKFVTPVVLENETGNIVSYFQNGSKAMEYAVKKGSFEGKSLAYNMNGKVANEKFYKNDELQGMYKSYYKDGTIREEENYLFGNLHGKCKYYYPNGKLERIEVYYLDQKHGDWQYFDQNGKLIRVEKWRYGYKI